MNLYKALRIREGVLSSFFVGSGSRYYVHYYQREWMHYKVLGLPGGFFIYDNYEFAAETIESFGGVVYDCACKEVVEINEVASTFDNVRTFWAGGECQRARVENTYIADEIFLISPVIAFVEGKALGRNGLSAIEQEQRLIRLQMTIGGSCG